MDTLTGILVALTVAALAPIAAFVSERVVEAGRRRRAYQRIVAEPLIEVDAVLHLSRDLGPRQASLMGPCRITSLAWGRMEVRSLDGQAAMAFTGREFEALHPVVALKPPPRP